MRRLDDRRHAARRLRSPAADGRRLPDRRRAARGVPRLLGRRPHDRLHPRRQGDHHDRRRRERDAGAGHHGRRGRSAHAVARGRARRLHARRQQPADDLPRQPGRHRRAAAAGRLAPALVAGRAQHGLHHADRPDRDHARRPRPHLPPPPQRPRRLGRLAPGRASRGLRLPRRRPVHHPRQARRRPAATDEHRRDASRSRCGRRTSSGSPSCASSPHGEEQIRYGVFTMPAPPDSGHAAAHLPDRHGVVRGDAGAADDQLAAAA